MAEELSMKGDDHYRAMITPQLVDTDAGQQKMLPVGPVDLEVAQIELALDIRKLLLALAMQAGVLTPSRGSGLYIPQR